MSLLSHIVIVAAYGLAALALGVSLPGMIGGLDAVAGYWAGLAFFLGASLIHSLSIRLASLGLYNEVEQLRTDLFEAEDQVGRLEAKLDRISEKAESNETLIEEMRMMRAMLGRLHGGRRFKGAEPVKALPAAVPLDRQATGVSDQSIIEAVEEALEANRVDLYLQPVVRLPQRKPVFYEGFSRIRDADGQVITPQSYLELADEMGLLPTIDNLLLFRCVQLTRRVRHHRGDLCFFVNLSPSNLQDRQFFAQFAEFLERNEDLSLSLIFEMSQADYVAAGELTVKGLARLGEMGFQLSLDRVYDLDLDAKALARGNVRYLKVDADFLLALGDGEAGGGNLRLAGLRRSLIREGIQLIASKVEEESEVLELLEADVRFAQGYLFGEPKLSNG